MNKTDIIGQRSTHFLKRLQQFILLLVKLVLRHVMLVLISELENTKMQLLRHFIRSHICRFIAHSLSLSLSLVPCMFVLAICKLLAVIVRKYINSKRGMCSVLFDPLDTSYWLEQSLQRNVICWMKRFWAVIPLRCLGSCNLWHKIKREKLPFQSCWWFCCFFLSIKLVHWGWTNYYLAPERTGPNWWLSRYFSENFISIFQQSFCIR